MKYARMRDKNEKAIVAALRAAGASVTQLDGAGVPDLLIGLRGRTWLVEVKNPDAKGGGKYNTGQGELTAAQVKWHSTWNGEPVAIVHDEAEALKVIA